MSDYVLQVEGRCVVDGFVITRSWNALQAGTVAQTGVYSTAGSQTWRLSNCMITGHKSSNFGGMYQPGGTTIVDHCTFFKNQKTSTSSSAANGIYVSGGTLTLVGSILWNDLVTGSEIFAVVLKNHA